MSVGTSGRVVVEVNPELKRELHSALAKDGKTLKDWFVAQAKNYVESRQQLTLSLTNEMGTDPDGRLPMGFVVGPRARPVSAASDPYT